MTAVDVDGDLPRTNIISGDNTVNRADINAFAVAVKNMFNAILNGTQEWAELADPPPTPPAGTRIPFFKADGLYMLDDAGVATKVSGGIQNNLAATTAPTVNEDSGDGYVVGSLWIDTTNDRVYQAVDVSVGAAVWLQLSHKDSLIIRDEKTTNTAGGTFTSGAWQTRTLNTVHSKTGIFAAMADASILATNQITLPAGTYRVLIFCPAQNVNAHKARLQNITDGTRTLIGMSAHAGATGGVGTSAVISGRFTITAQKVFEVQHQATTTRATDGFGLASNFDTEIYTTVEIERE
jgi:hypothetical protein